jgi:hypothetical protein
MYRILLLLLISPFITEAQVNTNDSLARKLVERHKLVNAAKKSMPGYRIQIYFGNDRIKAQEMRTEFIKLIPDEAAYLIYQQPNFKVRVGDFRTRLEAAGFLKQINSSFPNAFIVPDEVKLPAD